MQLIEKQNAKHHKPKNGWKPNCWYLVEVAFSTNNPVHTSLMYTGFLDTMGNPCGYSCLIAENSGHMSSVHEAIYINPLKELYDIRNTKLSKITEFQEKEKDSKSYYDMLGGDIEDELASS